MDAQWPRWRSVFGNYTSAFTNLGGSFSWVWMPTRHDYLMLTTSPTRSLTPEPNTLWSRCLASLPVVVVRMQEVEELASKRGDFYK